MAKDKAPKKQPEQNRLREDAPGEEVKPPQLQAGGQQSPSDAPDVAPELQPGATDGKPAGKLEIDDAELSSVATDPASAALGYDFIRAFTSAEAILRKDKATIEFLDGIRDTIEQGVETKSADPDLAKKILIYSYGSLCHIPGYATLNSDHIARLLKVADQIGGYINDKSLERPLNFLLLSSPGAGKSHLVSSIVRKLSDAPLGLVKFNMATMQSLDDLVPALDNARNFAIAQKLPVMFLDEFDSLDSNYPLLLPLLWDGELGVANRDLRIGRCIFFLAGSRDTLPGRLKEARQMFASTGVSLHDDKLVDIFSRTNGGVLEVPPLAEPGAVADKVVLAMTLLRRRFTNCTEVPRSLLYFLAFAKFRYEARSIETLINLIQPKIDAKQLSTLTDVDANTLPLNSAAEVKESPLAFHVAHEDGARGLPDLWSEAKERLGMQPLRDKGQEKELATSPRAWANYAWSLIDIPTDGSSTTT